MIISQHRFTRSATSWLNPWIWWPKHKVNASRFSLDSRIERLISLYADLAREPIENYDNERLESLIAAVQMDPEILLCWISDADDLSLTTTVPEELGGTADNPADLAAQAIANNAGSYAVAPSKPVATRIGTIHIAVSLSEVLQQRAVIQQEFAAVSGALNQGVQDTVSNPKRRYNAT